MIIRQALYSLLIITVIASAMPAAAADEAIRHQRQFGPPQRPLYLPSEVLVGFRAGVSASEMAAAHARVPGSLVSQNRTLRIHRVRTPLPVEEAMRRYLKNPAVAYAQPNYLAWPSLIPNDPFYDNFSGAPNDLQKWYLGPPGITAESGWDTTTGRSDVVIAIIDTGIDLNHPELASLIWTNPGELPADGIDNDGNGFIDDINGWDFYTGTAYCCGNTRDNDPNPDLGDGVDNDGDTNIDDGVFHGTFTAGTSCASSNNGAEGAGAAWNCSLMALKVFTDDGGTPFSDVIDAITYAADNGAHVINMSLGTDATESLFCPVSFPAVEAAVTFAHNNGVIVLSAAGNDNSGGFVTPASCTHSMSIGASDSGSVLFGGSGDIDGRASFSNFGHSDVVAAGVDIVSPWVCSVQDVNVGFAGCAVAGGQPVGFLVASSGTSFSTPLVSGHASLLISNGLDNGLTPAPAAVRACIETTALDLPNDTGDVPDAGSAWDGNGMAQVAASLADADMDGLADCLLGGTVSTTAFVVERLSGELSAVDLATGLVTLRATGLSNPIRLSVDTGGGVAWVTESSSGELSEVNLLNGAITQVTSGLSNPAGVFVDATGTTAWVTEETSGELSQIDIATGVATLLTSGLSSPTGVTLDPFAGAVYITEFGSGELTRYDLTTGIPAVIASGLSGPNDVTINSAGSKALVTESSSGGVSEVDLTTGVVTPVATGFNFPVGVALDPSQTAAFVTDVNTGELLEVDPSTGVVSPVASGLSDPLGVALFNNPPSPTVGPVARIVPSIQDPATGSQITACTFIDMTATPDLLGSYGVEVAWDPAVLSFVTFTPGFGAPVVNTSNAGAGLLAFAGADAAGAGGDVFVLCSEYTVVGPAGSSTSLNLGLTSLFAAVSFTDLLPIATIRNGNVIVLQSCTVGDVNGDTLINSGDALLILSDLVGIQVPATVQAALAARCGDADGQFGTDAADANVILSFEVGLPIDPLFPIGGPNATFDFCPSCGSGGVDPGAAGSRAVVTPGEGIAKILTLSTPHPLPGREFDLTVALDLSATGRTLGSYHAELQWNTKMVEFVSVRGGMTSGFQSPVLNSTDTANGRIRFATASPFGAPGTVELITVRLRARRAMPKPEQAFDLQFGSIAAPGPRFESLLPLLERESRE